jgi:hypothetical protein
MSLIDGNSAQIPLFELLDEGADEQALGCHVEEADSSLVKVAPSSTAFFALQGGIQACGSDAIGSQAIDLILHEGDEGGDDDRQAVANESGQLKAQ